MGNFLHKLATCSITLLKWTYKFAMGQTMAMICMIKSKKRVEVELHLPIMNGWAPIKLLERLSVVLRRQERLDTKQK